jgi:GH15 family glucan-1,4-alpha-glucosidase
MRLKIASLFFWKGGMGLDMQSLIETSKQIIKLNQHSRGGYAASPLFSHYGYSWLRDGTFIAYAMDISGETQSAGQFYAWVHQVLQGKRAQVDGLLDKHRRQQWIERNEFLNARYHFDGRDDSSEWGNFQLDGYGAWLWGLSEHIRITGNRDLLDEYRSSIELTLDYLQAFWLYPNYDCWEENPDYVHPATLACLYGGFKAIGELEQRDNLIHKAQEIQKLIQEHAIYESRFVKSIQVQDGKWVPVLSVVDASLLWLALPFQAIEASNPIMLNTVKEIEQVLKHGGIQRYAEDSYYGGGEWIILTAWYGWYKAELGELEEAKKCLEWIALQADHLGRLPEQVPHALRHPEQYDEWIGKWGDPAMPLLWSHAMLMVLYNKLK